MSDESNALDTTAEITSELDTSDSPLVPVDDGGDSEVDGPEPVVEVCKDGPGRMVIPRAQLDRHLAEGFVVVDQEGE